jgi:hypothetical protein
MSIQFAIYLVGIVDGVLDFSIGVLIISAIIAPFTTAAVVAFTCDGHESDIRAAKLVKPWRNLAIVALILSSLITIFSPRSGTLAAMYMVPKIVENKQLTAVPDKVLKVMNAKLDSWLEDITKTKK